MHSLTAQQVSKFQKGMVFVMRLLSLVMVPIASVVPSVSMEKRFCPDFIVSLLYMFTNLYKVFICNCPRGLTFSWWGCYSLCHKHKPNLPTPFFLFYSCVCFCLYGPFNSISFHKFFRQLFAFSLCSSGINSALLVLSTIYLFTKVSLSSNVILCG